MFVRCRIETNELHKNTELFMKSCGLDTFLADAGNTRPLMEQ